MLNVSGNKQIMSDACFCSAKHYKLSRQLVKGNVSWGTARSTDSPIPPRIIAFFKKNPCPLSIRAKHVLPMGWVLSSRIIFNKVNTYCHSWQKEYKYFVFDEITTVNWHQEKSPIFCIVAASIIFAAKTAFVLSALEASVLPQQASFSPGRKSFSPRAKQPVLPALRGKTRAITHFQPISRQSKGKVRSC